MKRFTLAALVLLATVSTASAFSFTWPPSQYPTGGSFDGPAIVTQDGRGN